MTEEVNEYAEEDLQIVQGNYENKKRRRAIPQGSTPIEVAQIPLLPNYRIKRGFDGLGPPEEKHTSRITGVPQH